MDEIKEKSYKQLSSWYPTPEELLIYKLYIGTNELSGLSIREIAKRLGISHGAVYDVIKRIRGIVGG